MITTNRVSHVDFQQNIGRSCRRCGLNFPLVLSMPRKLFKIISYGESVNASNLQRAVMIAEKIILSEVFRDCVLDLFVGHPRKGRLEYIDPQAYLDLLTNSIITIELKADGFGNWADNLKINPSVCVNPELLLEMKIRGKEFEECISKCNSTEFNFDDANLCKGSKKLYSQEDQQNCSSSNSTIGNIGCNSATMHVLVLTTMIIHETSQLINRSLSMVLVPTATGIVTPTHFFKHNTKEFKYKNYGHMIEKELFGFVIKYSISQIKGPFGLEYIIGSEFEEMNGGVVLVPSHEFMRLLTVSTVDEIDTFEINKTMLKLVPTEKFEGSALEFKDRQHCSISLLDALQSPESSEYAVHSSDSVRDTRKPSLVLVAKSDGRETVASRLANRFIRS